MVHSGEPNANANRPCQLNSWYCHWMRFEGPHDYMVASLATVGSSVKWPLDQFRLALFFTFQFPYYFHCMFSWSLARFPHVAKYYLTYSSAYCSCFSTAIHLRKSFELVNFMPLFYITSIITVLV